MTKLMLVVVMLTLASPSNASAADCGDSASGGGLSVPSRGLRTTTYGWQLHPLLGEVRLHTGWDYDDNPGASVYAAAGGEVIFAEWYEGSGLRMIVQHPSGLQTVYDHLQRMLAKVGACVRRGDEIAKVGSTGLSSRPHLHFEVWQGGQPFDPAQYVNALRKASAAP